MPHSAPDAVVGYNTKKVWSRFRLFIRRLWKDPDMNKQNTQPHTEIDMRLRI